MAVSTVTQRQHRASDGTVKGKSEFGETPRKRHWWQRAEVEVEPAPRVRSTFPNPDAPTQAIPPVPQPRPKPAPAPKPQVLYRERPTDIDRAGYNLMGLLAVAGRDKWSAGRLLGEIEEPLSVLRRIRDDEDAAAQRWLARKNGAAAAVETAVEGIRSVVAAAEAANELPGVTVKAEIDTDALGSELSAVTANAHSLSDATMTFEPITPDMPDPRVRVSVTTVTVDKPASPVHVPGDGVAPEIPAADEVADPGAAKPLPKRVPQRRPVDVLPADLALDPYEAVDPTVEGQGLVSGAWVFDEGGSTGPVWFLLAEQEDALRDRGRVAVLKFANGFTREVDAGTQVKVLDVRRAQALLAEHERKLAARDAEQAGAGQ